MGNKNRMSISDIDRHYFWGLTKFTSKSKQYLLVCSEDKDHCYGRVTYGPRRMNESIMDVIQNDKGSF